MSQETKQPEAKQAIAPTFGEYQGKPTITLKRSTDDKYPFTFGKAKAKLIVEHIEAIRQFAAS